MKRFLFALVYGDISMNYGGYMEKIKARKIFFGWRKKW